ncbi:MAG: hypothetical protein HY927_02160 [Elusimicrobia bacterium]|nr:hypothetical protein [Elusimicrobiota bacterium]
MRAWGSARGYVVDRGPSAEGVPSELSDELPGGAPRELHDYLVLDASGAVRETCRVSVCSLDDELSLSAYAVVDGELRNLRVSLWTGQAPRITRKESVVESGLREPSPADLEFVGRALAGLRQKSDQEDARRRREADARLAAIPGAAEDHAAGADFQNAQELLRRRVEDYGGETDAKMLRTLVRFGRLQSSLGAVPAFAAARDAFVLACRRQGFDRSLPPKDPLPPPVQRCAGDRADLRALEETLAGLEKDLLREAQQQEMGDANLNAAQIRMAAEHVARARRALGPSGRMP